MPARIHQAIIGGSHLNIQNAVILGYATTANSTATTPFIDSYGSVTGLTSTGATSSARIDNSRISNNANQYAFNLIPEDKLPGSYAGDFSGINLHDGTAKIGTPGATVPSRYIVSALSLASNDVLKIQGPVIIDVTGNLTIQGSARIVVSKGHNPDLDGSAQIYVAGNLNIGGGGGGGGGVYVADTDNHTIRTITPTWTVATLAG